MPVLLTGPATGTVITEILPGVKATAKKGTVRTRGGAATATLTIEEGFKGAFEVGQKLEVEFKGIPENVTVGVAAADADPPADPENAEATLGRSVDGAETLTGDAEGDDKSLTLTLGIAAATEDANVGALSDGVILTLTLNTKNATTTTDDDVSLPLTMGDITARVTLLDTAPGVDSFDDAFTSPMNVFEIRPAQCTMLFPLVTYISRRRPRSAFVQYRLCHC